MRSARIAASLIALMVFAAGCTSSGASDEEAVEQSSEALSLAGPIIVGPVGPTVPKFSRPDPNQGIVGRGFNRRVPTSRVYFVDTILAGGGWKEAAAPDRAQCVEFPSGIASPNVAMNVTQKATLVNSSSRLERAASFGLGNKVDASVVIPLEGVPLPVGANLDRSVSGETLVNSSSSSVNISLYSVARIADPLGIRGVGGARLRTAVLDDINALPAAERRSAFFAKCGDRYLDQVVTGGALAIDIAITAKDSKTSASLEAKVRDSVGINSVTGSNENIADDALSALLELLKIRVDNSLDADASFSLDGQTGTVRISLRSLGPVIDTSAMTIGQALALFEGWKARVQNSPSERAVISATGKVYNTVDNAASVSSFLPGPIDIAYQTLATQVKGYYLANYGALSNFTAFEKDMSEMTASERAEKWFDDVSGFTPPVVSSARRAALRNAFADAQALECLVTVSPGSGTSAYNACMTQQVLDTGTTTSPVKLRFPRLSRAINAGSGTINVASVGTGLGTYPALPRLREVIDFPDTFTTLRPALALRGLTAPLVEFNDTSERACVVENNGGKMVFISGRTDDLNPLTSSVCRWSLFRGLNLKPGWSVSAIYTSTKASQNHLHATPGLTTARLDSPTALVGDLKVDHEWLNVAGIVLDTVSFEGPLPANGWFGTPEATDELSLALEN